VVSRGPRSRIESDELAEEWTVWDTLGLMQQIEAVSS
jgi:hypothetical protein